MKHDLSSLYKHIQFHPAMEIANWAIFVEVNSKT